MRLLTLVLSVAFAGCGGAPVPPGPIGPPPSPAPSPPSAVASAGKPPSQPEPPGPGVRAPRTTTVCELAGPVRHGAFDLAVGADGPSFAHAPAGTAKVIVGEGGSMFAEIATPAVTVRGIVRREPAGGPRFLYPARWFSFGGVYFPEPNALLGIRDAHDGKLVVSTPVHETTFSLVASAQVAEVPCGEAGPASPEAAHASRAPRTRA